MPAWTCPRCQRQFGRKGQSHECAPADHARRVLLDGSRARAPDLRGGAAPRRDARTGPRRAGVGRHLPETVADLRRAPADAEVAGAVVRPSPPRRPPADHPHDGRLRVADLSRRAPLRPRRCRRAGVRLAHRGLPRFARVIVRLAIRGPTDDVADLAGGRRPAGAVRRRPRSAAISRSTRPPRRPRCPRSPGGSSEFLPWYSSVHRGAGLQVADGDGRLRGGPPACCASPGATARDDVAILCRNTTEAINHLAYRLRLEPDDVVVTTVVEHHANLLPWARVAAAALRRVRPDGHVHHRRRRRAARRRRAPAAAGHHRRHQRDRLAARRSTRSSRRPTSAASRCWSTRPSWPPHRPLPAAADFVAFSGHKLYAPFGAGASSGLGATFADGDPFLAGGGAVDLVDLDEVIWTDPPEREEAARPTWSGPSPCTRPSTSSRRIGWDAIGAHERELATRLRRRAGRASTGVRVLGPGARRRDAGRRHLHRRGRAPRAGGGPADGRVRHRRAPRLLLRPPLPDPAARPAAGRGRRLPRRRRRRRPHAPSRRGAGQRGLSTSGDDVDALLDAVAAIADGSAGAGALPAGRRPPATSGPRATPRRGRPATAPSARRARGAERARSARVESARGRGLRGRGPRRAGRGWRSGATARVGDPHDEGGEQHQAEDPAQGGRAHPDVLEARGEDHEGDGRSDVAVGRPRREERADQDGRHAAEDRARW